MFALIDNEYTSSKRLLNGNRMIIGNGHLGYRGTLEEYEKEDLVALNVIGVYDQYQDLWRESINLPNPFFTRCYYKDIPLDVRVTTSFSHVQKLNFKHGIFSRKTVFEIDETKITIESQRFVSKARVNQGYMEYIVSSSNDIELVLESGIDGDIWEINGPHFKNKKLSLDKNYLLFEGVTNEGQNIILSVLHVSNESFELVEKEGKILKRYNLKLKANQEIKLVVCFEVFINRPFNKILIIPNAYVSFVAALKAHEKKWNHIWKESDVIIKGDDEAQYALRYSLYQLLSLATTKYPTSIPARGCSGQMYKGAIFWDTEVFMLPLFLNTDTSVAKKLIEYRINTLEGAKNKAKHYGYEGAFYAWESQEDGRDACSLYNVTDPITGAPIRTYFADKQIHISGDVSLGIIRFYEKNKDDSLLINGGLLTMLEIAKFYLSYATYNKEKDRYDLNDVIGPDEYHERVNNNAFTNYLVHYVIKKTVEYCRYFNDLNPSFINKLLKQVGIINLDQLVEFTSKLYLPKPNKEGVIEQFEGYFDLEDVLVDEVRSRLKHEKEYWGGKNGVATPTRVIKQADVVTLLALFPNLFSKDIMKANYDFYEKYTEHGSSLSACMHAILACHIGRPDIAYPMFMKSAKADLEESKKMFAGGIFIGGTHPASNGGAYLSVVYGFAGLNKIENGYEFKPNLPKSFEQLSFRIVDGKGYYKVDITKEKIRCRRYVR